MIGMGVLDDVGRVTPFAERHPMSSSKNASTPLSPGIWTELDWQNDTMAQDLERESQSAFGKKLCEESNADRICFSG